MIFDQVQSPADHVLALVHIPKTAGTSVRVFLRSLFEPDQCLEFYHGEIEEMLANRQKQVRFAAGHHIRWGIQQYFQKSLLLVTVVRDPVDRYVSLYKEIKNTPGNPLHPYAADRDVNTFLDFLMESQLPNARAQLNNLQCRLICGEQDAALAARYVHERYYLACAIDQVETFAAMIAGAYAKPNSDLPRLNVRDSAADAPLLSPVARERIQAVDAEDLKLYLAVREQFSEFVASRRSLA